MIRLTSTLLLLLSFRLLAQSPLGQWTDHLPYNRCISLDRFENTIYCATRHTLFTYNLDNGEIERFSKINSLSNIGITSVKVNPHNGVIVLTYENGAIDLIQDEQTYSLQDIANSDIVGDKGIYNILFEDEFAYLSCGFGIVVLNTQKQEIKETYLIGENATNLKVYDMVFLEDTIFAATAEGIRYAPRSSPNLSNFQNWNQDLTLPFPNDAYTHIDAFNNDLYMTKNGIEYRDDTLYAGRHNDWRYVPLDTNGSAALEAKSIISNDSLIVVCNDFSIHVLDQQDSLVEKIFQYETGNPKPYDIIFDDELGFWVADEDHGLVYAVSSYRNSSVQLISPDFTNAFRLTSANGAIYTSTGGVHGVNWNNHFDRYGYSILRNGDWYNYSKKHYTVFDTIYDFMDIAVNPLNPDQFAVATYGTGVLIVQNDSIVTDIYDERNSILQERTTWGGWCGVCALEYDPEGNLWMASSFGASHNISVLKADGNWAALNFGTDLANRVLGDMIITSAGHKWILLGNGNGGLYAFTDNGTIDDTSDDMGKHITIGEGQGNLPTSHTTCLVEDLDGEIWVGTSEGIAVFYNPENVFTNSSFDAQQIYIQQDGNTQILLETEEVTCITIDGANRKWIGTAASGVFLMSADGSEQILAFNESNSPLFSNEIEDIAIDELTGEVYIATSEGVLSYRSDATKSNTYFSQDVYAYPNPVKPDYDGPIAIQGLVRDTEIRITDVAGNLVFKTLSLGGQAMWDGKNLNNEKVSTGVYLIYCNDQSGEQTALTKILFIN